MISLCKPLILSGVVFALALPIMGQSKAKKSSAVPALFLSATYVYVEAYDGNEFDPRLLPQDRKAIADVEAAVRKWGRYRLTMRRSEAEIVMQVRKGRIASATARIGASVGTVPSSVQFPPSSRTETSTSVGAGAEVGPPDDLLWVYTVDTKGELAGPCWRKMQKDGLNAPELKLFQTFKEEVDAAAAVQVKKKTVAPANATGTTPGTSPSATPTPPPPPLPNHP